MDAVRVVVVLVAALSTGLMAGVFGLYSNAIMPGLRRTDDRTFVGAFGEIDRAIMNPLFMTTFLAPLLTSAAAALLVLGEDHDDALPWCVAAFVLYLFVVVRTISFNVPLNDALKAEGRVAGIADPAAVRERFSEARWVSSNHARTVASTVAFGSLLWALVELGRSL